MTKLYFFDQNVFYSFQVSFHPRVRLRPISAHRQQASGVSCHNPHRRTTWQQCTQTSWERPQACLHTQVDILDLTCLLQAEILHHRLIIIINDEFKKIFFKIFSFLHQDFIFLVEKGQFQVALKKCPYKTNNNKNGRPKCFKFGSFVENQFECNLKIIKI